MKVLLMLDGRSAVGGTPLIQHNERMQDPLDEITRAVAKLTGKRKKTDADHIEIGHLEFLGGMYVNGNGPCIPGWNILRCLQDGAKQTKRGEDVLRGVSPLAEYADLMYEGDKERDPEKLWKAGGFVLRKGVGVAGRRVTRTRPIFFEWTAALPVEVDPAIFDPDTLASIWTYAGKYRGIGDRRPVNGKFLGTATEWAISTDDGLARAASLLADAVRCGQIRDEDLRRLARDGDPASLLAGGAKRAQRVTKKTAEIKG